ncbi:3D-(3,5/4)-trihydroxycyclohexane-1,2-dione acylhydrolase (decyclizing) [Fulvitalea axinellae]|uniref:3D-(3,5/4)-trihydroxycyclohexane-1,2-dione acylhydrolase (Decyclizing) n=1 Tax=Fulvitalea axinellae TaxID=1182444 RepID=A0AAU9CMM8_9BACT|nr:3D-(3,5/4)-trihydroxycyclohexane-1,2-dione acylhydrolase (decyclizing) [Fulvitalea axinellae]
MATIRLTVAQALIRFLKNQYVRFDGEETRFFKGCFGIFGHGNVAGIGQALQEYPDFTYYQSRNEQAMVHTAIAYAKTANRRQAFACTTSIGPGAMNMVTAAQTATINRIPVLLLPGDIFARREPDPVLQQVEYENTQDMSANDCFRPVSKFWDRINRAEQLMPSLLAAMRVLTSPADTGAVTLAMPQDVQAEAYDYPEEFFDKRVWDIPRNRPDSALVEKAASWIKSAKRPVIVAGGGVKYSEAESVLEAFAEKTGIPIGETFAGKGSVPYDKPYCLGGLGATGTKGAIEMAGEADLIIGVGTRYSDFTSASNSLFQNPDVRFLNINVKELDSYKRGALPLTGDAKITLEELAGHLKDYQVEEAYREEAARKSKEWDDEVSRIYDTANGAEEPIDQASVIGTLNAFMDKKDIMVCAAGSLPGDLHKLWRSSDPKNFHLEYGNSCMGYEIAGGVGVKMAEPDREVYVMVGDGSYWMLNHEIISSIQEGNKVNILVLDNSGYASIGALSESVGSARFGTKYRYREDGELKGECLPVDIAKNAESLGARVIRANSADDLKKALAEAKSSDRTTVIYIKTNLLRTVKGYHAWWEVPVAEVSTMEDVQQARETYVENKKRQKYHF